MGRRSGGSDGGTALGRDVEAIRGWLTEGRSVYVYFTNDAHAHAIANALTLKELLA